MSGAPSPKSRSMAGITMAATTAAIFALYFAGRRSKAEEHGQSIYNESQSASGQGGQLGGDSKSGSSGVREAMHSSSKQS